MICYDKLTHRLVVRIQKKFPFSSGKMWSVPTNSLSSLFRICFLVESLTWSTSRDFMDWTSLEVRSVIWSTFGLRTSSFLMNEKSSWYDCFSAALYRASVSCCSSLHTHCWQEPSLLCMRGNTICGSKPQQLQSLCWQELAFSCPFSWLLQSGH